MSKVQKHYYNKPGTTASIKAVAKKAPNPQAKLQKSVITEAFRTLRTNIAFSSVDHEVKTILVTSSSVNEGKTTIATNLAVAFALDGKKTLLVDCDLRNPSVWKFFEKSQSAGFTDILVNDLPYQSTMSREEWPDHLYIINTGATAPNPSELLGSNRTKNLIERFKNDFDVVIIDSPPVGLVSDAAILSKIVDAVLLVAVQNQTQRDDLLYAKDQLDRVGANLIGVVMNMSNKRHSKYYGKYYG